MMPVVEIIFGDGQGHLVPPEEASRVEIQFADGTYAVACGAKMAREREGERR
jgi:hypothetical protein